VRELESRGKEGKRESDILWGSPWEKGGDN